MYHRIMVDYGKYIFYCDEIATESTKWRIICKFDKSKLFNNEKNKKQTIIGNIQYRQK